MRTVLLIIITLGVLAGAFVAYSFLQTPPPAAVAKEERKAARPTPVRPAPPASTDDDARNPAGPDRPQPGQTTESAPPNELPTVIAQSTPTPTTQPTPRVIGASDNVWVQNYDEKTRRLSSEFRAARFDPRLDDTVDVTNPEARFYLDEESVLVLRARSGRVFIPPSTGQRETLGTSRGQAPTRGEMFDVEMSLHRAVDGPAVVRCTMPNLVFDNDTFRIATEGYTDAGGEVVLADQVPVTIRGEDYDFDGFGLVVRWNELDGRLETLDVARGEKLVVKNPRALRLDMDEPADANPQPIVVRWNGPVHVSPAKISRTLTRQLFRMNLGDSVRITQGDRPLAEADRLEVSFTIDRQPRDAELPRDGEPRRDQPPIVVSLTGAPATARLAGMTAQSAVVTYDATSGSAELRPSADFPQVMLRDADGRLIDARRVEFDGTSRVATFTGPVRFELPLPDEPDAAGGRDVMLATATRQARVTIGDESGGTALRSASFAGDVSVEHPRLKLDGRELTLDFEPSGESRQPRLTGFAATGDVQARLIDEQAPQSIECRQLRVATRTDDTGRILPRAMHAEGGVRIVTPDQQLSAGLLDVTFRPLAPDREPRASLLPAGEGQEIATLLASENVKLRTADGSMIDADRVTLTDEGGQPWLTVVGAPARLGDAKGTLSAGEIRMDAKTGDATIVGGGSFDTVLASDDPARRQPATVTWKNDLRFVADDNVASADGGVQIVADQSDGTRLRGVAERLQLSFAPQESGESRDATAPPLVGRQLSSAMLLGDVQLSGLRVDDAGTLLQRMHLFGEQLAFDPATERITIASAGRMLVEDRRPPDASSRGNGAMEIGGARGATAFAWSDRLIFEPAQDRAAMSGDVLVVHQPDGPEQREMRLQADAVSAELAPGASSSGELATAQTPAAPIRKVMASGNARVINGKLEFLADQIEFRPPEDVLIARGSDRIPAVLLGEDGLSRGSFRELWLNTRTQESHLRDFRATVRR